MLCLTGQVPTHLIGNDAFQEADVTGITRPCTKHNYLVKTAENLCPMMREAVTVASTGRPGPVVIDLPKDIQLADVEVEAPEITKASIRYNPKTEPDRDQIRIAAEMLAAAERPVIYGGGGIINAGPEASDKLRELVAMTGFPTTLTLMGLVHCPVRTSIFSACWACTALTKPI